MVKRRADRRERRGAGGGVQIGGTVRTRSEEETRALGRRLASALRGGEWIALEGALGLGKTVLVKGIAEGLGIPPEEVTSPTFTLVQLYGGGRLPLAHVDLYRLDAPGELTTVGLDELDRGGAVVVVEWGEKLPPAMRRRAIRVRLRDLGEQTREFTLEPPELS